MFGHQTLTRSLTNKDFFRYSLVRSFAGLSNTTIIVVRLFGSLYYYVISVLHILSEVAYTKYHAMKDKYQANLTIVVSAPVSTIYSINKRVKRGITIIDC